jgi:hypothetical protein
VASSDLEYVHFSDALDIVNLAGGKFDPKREVISFLGWAIKEVFMEYCSHADNTETGGDEDTIKKQIDFIKLVQIFHVKALSNHDGYMKDCCSEALQLHNNGGLLTLVAEAYFQFGLSMTKVIVIKDEGDAYLKNA